MSEDVYKIPANLGEYFDGALTRAQKGIAEHKRLFQENRVFFPNVSNQIAWDCIDNGMRLAETIKQALDDGKVTASHLEQLHIWCKGTERNAIREFTHSLQKNAASAVEDNAALQELIKERFPHGSTHLNELLAGTNGLTNMMDAVDMQFKRANASLYFAMENRLRNQMRVTFRE